MSAIRNDELYGFISDSNLCIQCHQCINICYTNARRVVGKQMFLEEIMSEIIKDIEFYNDSGGGVTFSGGEPLLQSNAVMNLAQKCKIFNIHTALETAGYVPWKTFEQVLPHIDLLYIDLKHIDSAIHQSFTGVPNELILENIKLSGNTRTNTIVRIPVIPGFNDTHEIQERMMSFLSRETAISQVELLPFHRFGSVKYEGLGMLYSMKDVENLSKNDCERFADIGRNMGMSVKVGRD